MRTRACIALLAAGTLVGLSAPPAAAAPRPAADDSGDDSGLLGLRVRLGCPLCIDLGVLHVVHVRVHIGPGECDRPKPPAPPTARAETARTQTAGAEAAATAAETGAAARAAARPCRAGPGRAGPPRRASGHDAAAPAAQGRDAVAPPSVPRAVAAPPRRKNPLATLMVLVVIVAVIAAGAGVAFAAAP